MVQYSSSQKSKKQFTLQQPCRWRQYSTVLSQQKEQKTIHPAATVQVEAVQYSIALAKSVKNYSPGSNCACGGKVTQAVATQATKGSHHLENIQKCSMFNDHHDIG